MLESSDTMEAMRACGICLAPVLDGGWVLAENPWLGASCSEPCLLAARRAWRMAVWRTRRLRARRFIVGATLLAACVVAHAGISRRSRAVGATPPPRPPAASSSAAPAGWFGPEWPPTETSLLAALGRDAWIHPLAGPVRRMPRRDSRVFGAVRPGNRAIECRNGHCGVDLGGEIWGEQVRAVHDGVVDFVQRGPNPDHGGSFVRLSHRGGTVFTQYFHLAAIARGLERGAVVKSGDVIGLLGDTGVKESEPHLHFAISVRPYPEGPEKYMDPEPLIALWPLHVPLDGSETGMVTTVAQAGVPLGSAPLRRGRAHVRPRKGAGAKAPAAEPAGDEGEAGGEGEAASDSGGGESAAE